MQFLASTNRITHIVKLKPSFLYIHKAWEGEFLEYFLELMMRKPSRDLIFEILLNTYRKIQLDGPKPKGAIKHLTVSSYDQNGD